MVTPKFAIGDTVWLARFDASDAYVTCPDCGGTGRLRVTFYDETTVSIGCANCQSGYDEPTGRVKVYERKATAEAITVTGMELTGAKVQYRLGGTASSWRNADECDVFASHEEAMVRAQVVADEATEAERKRVFHKEKDTRTWSWNATYHRNEIRRAHKSIEYHTRKLNVASLKAREDKAAKAAVPLNEE